MSPEQLWTVGGLITAFLVMLLITIGMDRLNFDVIIGILTVMALTLVSVPALRWVSRAERDPGLLPILYWGLGLKIIFTLVRYFFITQVYGDNGDAGVYSGSGAILMDLYRKGIFTLTPPGLESRGPETARVAVVVGVIYMITGVSRYAASFVFSWFCFTGQIFMIRAFSRGVPEGDLRRYAALVLFLPSMLFWPSSIGKEALMVLSIGVASYGAAQLLGSRIRASGLAMFLLGASGLFFIRPHMAAIAVVALAFAAGVSTIVGFANEPDKEAVKKAFTIRLVALVVLVGAGLVATTQISKVLGGDSEGGGTSGVNSVLERTKAQTSEGGSAFDPPAVTSPVEVPAAIVTVLIRPFPWEGHSLNGIIAAAEGVLLVGLFFASRRRLLRWVQMLGKRPYLVFALAYAMTFVIAFSYIANFGILARQRTQMLPLALVLIGMYPAARTRRSWFGREADVAPDEPVTDDDPAGGEPAPDRVSTSSAG